MVMGLGKKKLKQEGVKRKAEDGIRIVVLK